MARGPRIARVALPIPPRRLFDYVVPARLDGAVPVGVRVEVPFGRGRGRTMTGFVVARTDETEVPEGRLKEVARAVDPRPVIGGPLLELTRWLAGYYGCSWGEALEAAIPGGTRGMRPKTKRAIGLAVEVEALEPLIRERQDRSPAQARVLRLLRELDGQPMPKGELKRRCQVSDSPIDALRKEGVLSDTQVDVDPRDALAKAFDAPVERDVEPELTPAQAAALETIFARLEAREFGVVLLHGVTGSGKTEVYLRAMQRALEQGGSAIALIPEIALTPQTVGRFRRRLGDGVAVLHSALSAGRRAAEWARLDRGDARIAVGPRSAVFAPTPADTPLRLLIVDEEHEPTYKQQSTPRYHARDVAVVRAKLEGALVILGSATPALESHGNAVAGKYTRVSLPRRVARRPLPRVITVDMRGQLTTHGQPRLFSDVLVDGLRGALKRGEQSILLLNRRGYSTWLSCPRCEHIHQCEACAVSMTYHQHLDRVVCHYCLAEGRPPRRCPACDYQRYRYGGAGTQRLEHELARVVPAARVARMDSDTMTTAARYEDVLGRFGRGELDVLCGTQMIAKGLDFPRVTVVGVLAADAGMHFPDFRAAERAFQLIAQVAGRAGRGETPGRVFVQTRFPEHHAIQAAARHDYAGFAEAELRGRQSMGYPPFGRLIRVVVEDRDEDRARQVARDAAERLRGPAAEAGVQLLGPAAAPLALLRERHRVQLLLKAAGTTELGALKPLLAELATGSKAETFVVDVDPTGML